MSAPTHPLSRDAYDRLIAEHEELSTHGLRAAEQAIIESRSAGDIAENPDFHVALAEKTRLEQRIALLATMIAGSYVSDGPVATDKVTEGVVVSISFDGASTAEKYLYGSIAASGAGLDVITPTSPLGEVINGVAAGETVTVQSPAGEMDVTVVAIEAA